MKGTRLEYAQASTLIARLFEICSPDHPVQRSHQAAAAFKLSGERHIGAAHRNSLLHTAAQKYLKLPFVIHQS